MPRFDASRFTISRGMTFRHDFASRLVMAGVSLRAVAELLGHKGLRMVMRLRPLVARLPERRDSQAGWLPAQTLNDRCRHAPPSPSPEPASEATTRAKGKKRAKFTTERGESSEIRDFVRKSGSSGWIRTS